MTTQYGATFPRRRFGVGVSLRTEVKIILVGRFVFCFWVQQGR